MTDPNTLAAAPPGEVVPCSECGRGIRLTRRQRLAAHNTSPSNLPGVTRCPGSDRLFSWPSPNTLRGSIIDLIDPSGIYLSTGRLADQILGAVADAAQARAEALPFGALDARDALVSFADDLRGDREVSR